MTKLNNDHRIDPRLRALFGDWVPPGTERQFFSREQLLAWEASEEGRQQAAQSHLVFDAMDSLELAPADGLEIHVEEFVSDPDGNRIKVRFTRPIGAKTLPCVYYIHGGGMQALSCFDGMYRAWARLIAAEGICVAMVDFRNALLPSSSGEVAPYPAGLNDCVSGFRWLSSVAPGLNIDPDRIVIAGESGGANLAIATAMRLTVNADRESMHGLYALCPCISGRWPDPVHPSSIEFDGIMLDSRSLATAVTAYGIEAFKARDPMAWPGFAVQDDVARFPRTVICVNECDPLRDEGIAFYRLLIAAGVRARCRQIMGTTHGAEIFLKACPEISRDAARDIAAFAR
jgi:acetyl esterase/lipase